MAFRYFPTEFLDYIDQIIMEVHFDFIYPDIWGNLDIFRSLADKFVNVNYHMNNYACYNETLPLRGMPARAFEVTLVNKNIIKLNSEDRSYKEDKLNVPNYDKEPDCQILK
jgi:hypothetical protein